MKKITIIVATAALALTACGSDSDSSSADAVAGFMAVAELGEVELDKSCVEDLAKGLSDADAEAIAAMADEDEPSEPNISEAGDEIGDRIFDECIKEEG